MILHHKGKRIDTGEEIKGFLSKMWGQYHITKEDDENTAYPVIEETIVPCYDELEQGLFWTNDIIFSEKLTASESSQFLWLLKKAQGKLGKEIEDEVLNNSTLNKVALENVKYHIFEKIDEYNTARIIAAKEGKVGLYLQMLADMQVVYGMLLKYLRKVEETEVEKRKKLEDIKHGKID